MPEIAAGFLLHKASKAGISTLKKCKCQISYSTVHTKKDSSTELSQCPFRSGRSHTKLNAPIPSFTPPSNW